MRPFILLCLALGWGLAAPSPTPHPFTFADMMALKRIGEPVPSPDGHWVLFSAVDVDLTANSRTPHVWIVPASGGEAREIISDRDADRPRWSPDGTRFLFLSTKEAGSQVWMADFDAPTGAVSGVHRLTDLATEAEGELWSPDGNNILFVSRVYPDCRDKACNEQMLEQAKQAKVKAMTFTRLLYRHWNAYQQGRRSHLFIMPISGGDSLDLTPGDYDAPVFSLGGQDEYAFAPDGQEICYTSNHDAVEATSTNNDLFVVSVKGGAAKKITENPASDSTPLYSSDGKYIAYRAQLRPGYESDRFRLMLYDRKTGERKNLTQNFDRWVGTFTWNPNSTLIYFNAQQAGASPVFSVSLTGDPVRQLPIVSGTNDDLTVTADQQTLLLTRNSLQAPNEIYAFHLCPGTCDARPAQQLTHLNDRVLSTVEMSPLEPFWFSGAGGAKVEGFLVKPPHFDAQKKYPVKFLIHGGPQGAWGDDWSYRWNPELFAADGYLVLMINFHGSTGYGQQFIDAIRGDWGGAPWEDLMRGLDYAEQHYPFLEKSRECALGASYGGYMINWILGHSDRFRCLVSHDGVFNTTSAWGTTEELWFNEWEFQGTPWTNRTLYDKWSPHLAARNFKTPTLVVHGQRDYRLDVSEGFQLFTTLQRRGVPSKMLYFPDEGHWVLQPQNSQLWYRTVNGWVDQWTK